MPTPFKETGFEWIGKIPIDWKLSRVGKFFIERNEKVDDVTYPPLSVTMSGIVDQLSDVAKTNDGDNRKLVKKNDFVIVKNVEKIKFTGHKFQNKKYYKHTGYPGGIKEITPQKLSEKNRPEEILKLAVKRMLPGGVLSKNQLRKLKIYPGENHPHSAQNPKILNVSKMNNKNLIRN